MTNSRFRQTTNLGFPRNPNESENPSYFGFAKMSESHNIRILIRTPPHPYQQPQVKTVNSKFWKQDVLVLI